MVILLYVLKPLTVSHHPVTFYDHWSSVSGDITYLIFHMISQDHVVEGSWLYELKLHTSCHRPSKFDGHSHGYSGDIMFLVVEEKDSLKLSQFCH